MIKILAAMFTSKQLVAELVALGYPAEQLKNIPNTVAATVIVQKRGAESRGLDAWAALYLDVRNDGKYDKDELQSVMAAAGCKSDKAWSSRLSRQRKPEFYNVKEGVGFEFDRARNVPASVKSGKVKLAPLSATDQSALAAFYQALEDAKPEVDLHEQDEDAS